MKVGFKKSNKSKRKVAKRAAAAAKASQGQTEPHNVDSGMGTLICPTQVVFWGSLFFSCGMFQTLAFGF
jgi:hypothetical protein